MLSAVCDTNLSNGECTFQIAVFGKLTLTLALICIISVIAVNVGSCYFVLFEHINLSV
jgi:hypothetical protein